MSLDTALSAYLGTLPTLAPLGGRVYPLLAPPGAAMPYLVYTFIAHEEVGHMSGVALAYRATYQLDLYAHTHLEARRLGNIVRFALQSWRNMASDPAIVHAVIDRLSVDTEERDDGGASMDYRLSIDTSIWAAESQPSLV